MENIYYVYPQVDPKVAFPRKAQPKVSISFPIFDFALINSKFNALNSFLSYES
jgi:hypothetical protein